MIEDCASISLFRFNTLTALTIIRIDRFLIYNLQSLYVQLSWLANLSWQENPTALYSRKAKHYG